MNIINLPVFNYVIKLLIPNFNSDVILYKYDDCGTKVLFQNLIEEFITMDMSTEYEYDRQAERIKMMYQSMLVLSEK